MPITAIALLRIQTLSALELKSLRVERLDDSVLVYTDVDFSNEPETLSQIVLKQAGDTLRSEHADPRGIFFIPDVALPRARTYEAVIEEIGEGGVWAAMPLEPARLGATPPAGDLGALLGGVLSQLPQSVWESVGEAARGRPGALEDASSQLKAAMAGSNELSELASLLSGGAAQQPPTQAGAGKGPGELPGLPDLASLTGALESSGIDLQKLMGQVQSALESDPERAAALAERFFGASLEGDDDDSDDEPSGSRGQR